MVLADQATEEIATLDLGHGLDRVDTGYIARITDQKKGAATFTDEQGRPVATIKHVVRVCWS